MTLNGMLIMRKLTLYRDDSTTQVVYENVKHYFWLAGNTVLSIAIVTNTATGEHLYVQWPRERFCWFKDQPMVTDAARRERKP